MQVFSKLITLNMLIRFENIIKLCSTGMNLSCCRGTDYNILKKFTRVGEYLLTLYYICVLCKGPI